MSSEVCLMSLVWVQLCCEEFAEVVELYYRVSLPSSALTMVYMIGVIDRVGDC